MRFPIEIVSCRALQSSVRKKPVKRGQVLTDQKGLKDAQQNGGREAFWVRVHSA